MTDVSRVVPSCTFVADAEDDSSPCGAKPVLWATTMWPRWWRCANHPPTKFGGRRGRSDWVELDVWEAR